MEREVQHLSGGELQRFLIAITAIQQADIYMFDELSSFLDIKQRLKAAKLIRSLLNEKTFVIAVEHDLSLLDFLSDSICVLYGHTGVFGVATMPYSVREGINIYLGGFIPSENMRFRDDAITFKSVESDAEKEKVASEEKSFLGSTTYLYPEMTKTIDNFRLTMHGGSF